MNEVILGSYNIIGELRRWCVQKSSSEETKKQKTGSLPLSYTGVKMSL